MGWFAPVSTVLGYGGAGLIAAAYFLNQRGSLRSDDWRFPAINLFGSVLVMISLWVQLNPPSVAIEVFWSCISVYGIQRNLRLRSRAASPRPGQGE